MHRRSFLGMVLGAVAAGGCSGVPPLANAHGSPEALANAVLEAFSQRDHPRLDALAVSEQEFRDHVWTDLPAARPERNLPFSYVWGDLHQKSTLSLASTLQKYGGERHTLRGVTFTGTTPYAHYTVHRDASFAVAGAGGTAQTIRVCGSFLEKDGTWKVFSYVVD